MGETYKHSPNEGPSAEDLKRWADESKGQARFGCSLVFFPVTIGVGAGVIVLFRSDHAWVVVVLVGLWLAFLKYYLWYVR